MRLVLTGGPVPVARGDWILAQSGCCSWHGGVCGCQMGTVSAATAPIARHAAADREEQVMRIAPLVAFTLLSLASPPSAGWDGYDAESGGAVEIERGELVRSGNDIQFYDYASGEYRDGTVEDINRSGPDVEVQIYDQKSGEYRTFEMEGD
jgi:hypothetical protein